jgi:hypothetical protein
MQSTGHEQLLDLPNKDIVGKVKGNIGNVMSSQVLQKAHLAGFGSEILQPPTSPGLGL